MWDTQCDSKILRKPTYFTVIRNGMAKELAPSDVLFRYLNKGGRCSCPQSV